MFKLSTLREKVLKKYARTGTLGINRAKSAIPMDNLQAWFDAAVEYITKDGSGYISQWNDKSGNLKHLTQGTGSQQPLWVASATPNGTPGVRFDGTDDALVQATLAMNQPFSVYLVLKQLSWTSSDRVLDLAGATNVLLHQYDNTPELNMYSTGFGPYNGGDVLGEYSIVMAKFKGDTSRLRIRDVVDATGNPGTTAAGSLTLGSLNGGGQNSNIEVAEILIYNTEHDVATEQAIFDAMIAKHGQG